MTELESKISQSIRAEIERRGGHSLKLAGSAHQGKGHPDIIGCLPTPTGAQIIVCETKRPGEQPRPLQWHRLREWRKAGAIAITATSVEDFNQKLEEQRGY